jgi:hypothetical protein
VSAGTAGATLEVFDETICARHADFVEQGVLSGLELTAGAGLSISIGTGLIWHRYRRDAPAAATIDQDDGLTENAGVVFVFYDDRRSPAYYASTGAPLRRRRHPGRRAVIEHMTVTAVSGNTAGEQPACRS